MTRRRRPFLNSTGENRKLTHSHTHVRALAVSLKEADERRRTANSVSEDGEAESEDWGDTAAIHNNNKQSLIYLIAFTQSVLWLIRLSRGQACLEQYRVNTIA